MGEMLSEHFSVAEFEYSDVAKAKHITNKLDEIHKSAEKHFCTYVLEPIRTLFNQKYGKVIIKITSGYRGPQLNKAVSGSSTSQHCANNGCGAADIWVYKVTEKGKVQIPVEETYACVKQWVKEKKVSVDQVINERNSKGTKKWLHIGTCSQLTQNRQQFLTYNGKSYTLDCILK